MTRQTAIDQMCKQCIYDPEGGAGTWRQQVAACTAQQCPLFQFRPLPRYETSEEKEKRLQRRIAFIEARQEVTA